MRAVLFVIFAASVAIAGPKPATTPATLPIETTPPAGSVPSAAAAGCVRVLECGDGSATEFRDMAALGEFQNTKKTPCVVRDCR